MLDAAIRFETAATRAISLLKEQEMVYEVEMQGAWRQFSQLLEEGNDEHKRLQIGKMFQHTYANPLRKLVKRFSDTHAVAFELLKALDLPTKLPQTLLNQLLVKRIEVELALEQLTRQTQVDVSACWQTARQQQRSLHWIGARVVSMGHAWAEKGKQHLLEGRMSYFRTILYRMGEQERRIFFLYAGAVDAQTRPFCATRAG
ncbi:MAG: hypothetical protein HQL93_08755 [Magnetococcales bacterium]|nr:hypothetical protein [Magnetococcales bacterium]